MAKVEYREADYGFILVHDGHFEIFGMIGIGFYELVCSCGFGIHDGDSEVRKLIAHMENEDWYADKLSSCRTTKSALL